MSEVTRATREPRASRFTQQQLKAFRPVLTTFQVGYKCKEMKRQVKELKKRYDHLEGCVPPGETEEDRIAAMQDPSTEIVCEVTLKLPQDIDAPVYVYYELEDYYQNHRRYVKSRSDDQLAGKSGGDKSDCKPKAYQHSAESDEDPDLPIKPCGLTAWSFFNDTIHVERVGGNESLHMTENNIAWESDVKYLFGNYTPENFNNKEAYRGGATIEGPLSENEHFIVWMRVASLPTFRKLYGVLHKDLKTSDVLKITIENRYNTYLFGGKKSIVLSTTSWLGGRSPFLGIMYVVMGCASFFMGFVYFLLHVQFPRDMGDERFLSWRRKNY